MIKRKKIAIVFSNDSGWIGGTYYIINLIYALDQLKDELKPHIVLCAASKKDFELVKKINYKYLSFLKLQFPNFTNNSFFIKQILFLFQNIFYRIFTIDYADIVFPYNFQPKLRKSNKKIYWIPDFQEHYYPDFFSKKEIQLRKKEQVKIAVQNSILVLSSNAALSDFKQFYPNATCTPRVINFAVTHPSYQHLNIVELKSKFGIIGDYFISPNQFWKHKNHIVILKAVKKLAEHDKNIKVVFTGKEYDYRNPTYTADLKKFVAENNLKEQVLFLGFIDRAEQLQLMYHAIAVIQPSLFEGWSTVVEDAKAMNQFVIASDIAVHQEQLKNNARFFNSSNEDELAEIFDYYSNHTIEKIQNDYSLNVKSFGEEFLKSVLQ
ncbi:MAG: glycosyltransferase family 4 protein [Bacteroidia bacterium]|nr:glycosyltransferase family 4 protein [Bacteroidia bacterium]